MVGRDVARPLIVLEGRAGAAEEAAAGFRAAGWEIVAGLRTPAPRGRRIVRTGVVADLAGAADAILAVLDGAGLIVDASADRDVIDRFVDDLRRVGPVEHRDATADRQPSALEDDARSLLALLADGYSLGEAAAELGLSRRTADRRLAAIRSALGADRTAEALVKARRLGWLPSGRDGDSRAS